MQNFVRAGTLPDGNDVIIHLSQEHDWLEFNGSFNII